MGITDKHTIMEEAANWPAEVHFHKINRRRTRRSQSPSREVSPVPSYFSEPVSIRKHKDVTGRLPRLIRGAHQDEDEDDDDDDDVQSLKSLPTVMNALASDPKVNRSHTVRKGQGISDLNLPLLVTSKCTLVVKGTGCTRTGGFLPAIKSTALERPPCRAGCRPDKVEMGSTQHPRPVAHPLSERCPPEKTWNIKASRQHLPSSSSNKVSSGLRITFQSPVVQGVYPITPGLMQESRHNVQACQPLRPVLKRAQVLHKGALHCLLEESYLPCSNDPHLLEPFSGFEEHLCHQLLNSPLPCRAALPHVNSHHLLRLEAMLPVAQGLGSSLMQRTVELCNPQGKQLPSITMTRPTPSPKHLRNTENRHLA